MRLSQRRSRILSHLTFRPLFVHVDSPTCTYARPIFFIKQYAKYRIMNIL